MPPPRSRWGNPTNETVGLAIKHAFRPAVDARGRTTEPGALVAGDGARILGAKIAVATGCIW